MNAESFAEAVRAAPAICPPTRRIVLDEDAAFDEDTAIRPTTTVTAAAGTDRGRCRSENEDRVLVLAAHGLHVIADGMGGHRAGAVASQLAVDALAHAYDHQFFPGPSHDNLPTPASELARAVQLANSVVHHHSQRDARLGGMGTTLCAALFPAGSQRLYLAHVGDSRVYRLRRRSLRQVTVDHTMRERGVTGAGAENLSRAIGLWPTVPIDVLLAAPRPGDVYLLCSDGLTKMLADAQIARILLDGRCDPTTELVRAANDHGGVDNVSVVVVRVDQAMRAISANAAI